MSTLQTHGKERERERARGVVCSFSLYVIIDTQNGYSYTFDLRQEERKGKEQCGKERTKCVNQWKHSLYMYRSKRDSIKWKFLSSNSWNARDWSDDFHKTKFVFFLKIGTHKKWRNDSGEEWNRNERGRVQTEQTQQCRSMEVVYVWNRHVVLWHFLLVVIQSTKETIMEFFI